MNNRTIMLFAALSLGLGWAIRGHFGHEHGAAWAGAMAGMAIIIGTRRGDWLARLPVLALLAGIGWGVGGMMSYGRIVGFCRGTDFANVYYGLFMLGVVGGLYGFIGGGLFGLGLESTEKNKPDWASLITQMVAIGSLFWYVIIAQFEWKMTPPRSELWAACLGASAALAWYLYDNGFKRALRTAGYAALGGGFGFAFGNFLQTMGTLTGIHFNWWNVMEFTLGFCGGLGMAYAVVTREWPQSKAPSRTTNRLAVIALFFAIPATNVIQAFDAEEFKQMAERIGLNDPGAFAEAQFLLVWITVIVFAVAGFLLWRHYQNRINMVVFFFIFSIFYTTLSHFKKGIFYGYGGRHLEQYIYWLILAILAAMYLATRKKAGGEAFMTGKSESWRRWILIITGVLVIIAVLTGISVNSHDGLPGAHERF